LPAVLVVEVEYEDDDAREWVISRVGEMGSFRVRDAVFVTGIVIDGFVLVEVEVVEVTERVSWSALTVAESGSPYSSFR
jgi:hypothetical protein